MFGLILNLRNAWKCRVSLNLQLVIYIYIPIIYNRYIIDKSIIVEDI